jgi:hypothetical protein
MQVRDCTWMSFDEDNPQPKIVPRLRIFGLTVKP